MPEGECTVTLQNVNIILGLPINGRAVTGRTSGQWIQIIYDFLGHRLDVGSTEIKGSQLKLRWLNETFCALPPDPTPLMYNGMHVRTCCVSLGFSIPQQVHTICTRDVVATAWGLHFRRFS
ncbi:Serine/threonine-protein phosphatase 7 long form homolog [Linum perenne]